MPNTDYLGGPVRPVGEQWHCTEHSAGCSHHKRAGKSPDAETKKAKKQARRDKAESAVSDDGDSSWEDVKKTPKKRRPKRHDDVRTFHFDTVVHTVPASSFELRIGGALATPSPQPKTVASSPSPRQAPISPQVGSPSKGGFWDYLAKMGQKPMDPVRIGDDVYMLPK